MDNLKLAAIVTHVADARTSVLHPASHTHRQLTDEQLIEAGVAPDLIRFSVGIEDVEDIIADIEQAFVEIEDYPVLRMVCDVAFLRNAASLFV